MSGRTDEEGGSVNRMQVMTTEYVPNKERTVV